MPDIKKEEKVPYVDPNKFDLRTHDFNARGLLRGKNAYRLHVVNGIQMFERPVNSGNLFYENNEEAGRVEYIRSDKNNKVIGKKFLNDAKHVAYKAPISGAEKLEMELAASQIKAEALQKELDAIKREQAEKESGMSKHVVGDETHYVDNASPLANAVEGADTQKGVSRSVKDSAVKETVPAQPHKGPTPDVVHAERAAEEVSKTPASGPGSGPTPDNEKARMAREAAKAKAKDELL